VKIIDRVAQSVITLGGLGVIVFFGAIILFLASVVWPLFKPAQVNKVLSVQLASAEAPTTVGAAATDTMLKPVATTAAGKPLAMEIDEYLKSLWILDDRAVLSVYRADGGELVKSESLTDVPVTAISNQHGAIALGTRDGTVLVGQIKYDTAFIDHVPDRMEALNRGETVAYDGGVAMMTPAGPRVMRTVVDLSEPLAVTEDKPTPVQLIDYSFTDRLEVVAAMMNDGRLFFNVVNKRTNVMTGKTARSVDNYQLPLPETVRGKTPIALLLGLNGRMVFVVYHDGHCVRYVTEDPASAYIAETVELLPGAAGKTISSVRLLLGSRTLIVADSEGGVTGWFPAPFAPGAEVTTKDREHVVKAHELTNQDAQVTAIATSTRDRQFATGDATGKVVLRHMTSGSTQATVKPETEASIACIAIAPKNDAIVVVDSSRHLSIHGVHNPHADGAMAGLFLPVHYEGYAEASQIWQSSSGTDDAEPKMSLLPLIFGTIKATLYAMVIAVPIAILAAIYSSEFMHPSVRSVVKPVVEMMASLPSVVLGFIAAMVLAPYLENAIPAALCVFIAVPAGVMLFGFIWQILPPSFVRSIPSWVSFATILGLVVLGVWFGLLVGPSLEKLLFFGDFPGWVGSRIGNAIPGWLVLFSPLFIVVLTIVYNTSIRRRFPILAGTGPRIQVAMIELLRVFCTVVLGIGLALLVATAFNAIGWDLRGSIVGPYVQRNTLIVGLVMGFAIIPIIYTVSEDALSSVPTSLRSAALGAGATPWQTAIRVVLPVALSGIFSACMIGFGRAAGETMIVLMAGGNTALLDANIFNGVRTLSANIAVELPEAPVHSTHYRVLFLSALVLFGVTFVVNTAAEIVRNRFRKRAYQL